MPGKKVSSNMYIKYMYTKANINVILYDFESLIISHAFLVTLAETRMKRYP